METKKKLANKKDQDTNAFYADIEKEEEFNLVPVNSGGTIFRDKETGTIFSLEQEQKAGGKMHLNKLNRGKFVAE